MPLIFDDDQVRIDAVCMVEDAMPLLEFFQSHAAARVGMRECTHLHSAVLQVLIAAVASDGARIMDLPEEDFLRRWLTPLFDQA